MSFGVNRRVVICSVWPRRSATRHDCTTYHENNNRPSVIWSYSACYCLFRTDPMIGDEAWCTFHRENDNWPIAFTVIRRVVVCSVPFRWWRWGLTVPPIMRINRTLHQNSNLFGFWPKCVLQSYGNCVLLYGVEEKGPLAP